MHLKLTRESLISALSCAAITATTKTTTPVLSCARFNATSRLTVLATDLKQYVTTRTEAEVIETGSCLIPVQQALAIAKQLPKSAEVTIRADNATVTIRSGRYHTTINALPVEDFPEWSASEFTASFSVPAETLADRFATVGFAQSTEETRHYLCGVYIHQDDGSLKFVATDGHRLGLSRIKGLEITGDLTEGVIIPKRTVTDVGRLLPGCETVFVSIGQSRIRFDFGDTQIESKLVEGRFPEYSRVIPWDNSQTVTVPASVLSATIERVAAISKERSRPVKIDISPDAIAVSCRDPAGDYAEDQIPVTSEISDFSVGVQARYMQDMLTQVKGDAICCFADSSAPVLVKDSACEDSVFVVMPVRI